MSRTILELHGIRLITLMAIVIAGVHAITPAKAQTVAVDEALLKRLEQIIAQQQQQLSSQSGTIEALKASALRVAPLPCLPLVVPLPVVIALLPCRLSLHFSLREPDPHARLHAPRSSMLVKRAIPINTNC